MCRISGGTRAVDSPITICITLHSWSTRGPIRCLQRVVAKGRGGTLPPRAPAFVRRLSDYRLQVHVILLVRRALRSEEHTSELQSRLHLVCRLLLEKKKKNTRQ